MRSLGLKGVVRGKKVITTNPDRSQPCPDDKVNRLFRAASSIWVGQTSCGFQTSPMCRPGRAALTWPLAMVLGPVAFPWRDHRRFRKADRRLAPIDIDEDPVRS